MGIGSRMRKALDLRGMSVRAFHREMSERGVRGASYPTIHRYLSDKSAPSVAFLKSAAELLEVRESWLAQGEGAPTAHEEEIRREGEARLGGESRPVANLTPIYESYPFLLKLPYDVQMAFITNWGGATAFYGADPEGERGKALCADLVQPLKQLPWDPDTTSPEFDHYIRAALLAQWLALAIPDAENGDDGLFETGVLEAN